jgi:hypothetical protein
MTGVLKVPVFESRRFSTLGFRNGENPSPLPLYRSTRCCPARRIATTPKPGGTFRSSLTPKQNIVIWGNKLDDTKCCVPQRADSSADHRLLDPLCLDQLPRAGGVPVRVVPAARWSQPGCVTLHTFGAVYFPFPPGSWHLRVPAAPAYLVELFKRLVLAPASL